MRWTFPNVWVALFSTGFVKIISKLGRHDSSDGTLHTIQASLHPFNCVDVCVAGRLIVGMASPLVQLSGTPCTILSCIQSLTPKILERHRKWKTAHGGFNSTHNQSLPIDHILPSSLILGLNHLLKHFDSTSLLRQMTISPRFQATLVETRKLMNLQYVRWKFESVNVPVLFTLVLKWLKIS